jgi:glyoxalase superfamily protein
MAQSRMRVSGVVMGAPNPRALAAFYARLLEWPVVDEAGPRSGAPPEDGWAQLRTPCIGYRTCRIEDVAFVHAYAQVSMFAACRQARPRDPSMHGRLESRRSGVDAEWAELAGVDP